MIQNEYTIKPKCATMKIPQAKSISEKNRQLIANLVCTFDFQNDFPYEDDNFLSILTAMTSSVHSMYHTKLQDRDIQLVF